MTFQTEIEVIRCLQNLNKNYSIEATRVGSTNCFTTILIH